VRALLAVLVVVGLAACSYEDDEGGDSGSDGGSDGGGDVGGLAALLGDDGCTGLLGLYSAVFAGGGDNGTLEALAEDGPEELRDDFDAFAEYFQGYFEALEDADIDPDDRNDPANAVRIGEVIAEWQENVDSDALEEAGERIETWAREECPTLVGD
jgi:hypothetical protein